MMKQSLIFIAIGIALVGGVLLFASMRTNPTEPIVTDRTTREVALTCDREMTQGMHIHPVLEIVVNGEKVPVPENVGIRATCMTAIHTHTPDGVIHVESPEKRDFTLGDFFAVWEQPFDKGQVLSYRADATHRVRMTVDGTEVDTYENTILKDGQRIVISYEAI
ncbi:MAG TPA: hypothetical protein VGB97_02335 [Candidatus Paceibacterota bacterium]